MNTCNLYLSVCTMILISLHLLCGWIVVVCSMILSNVLEFRVILEGLSFVDSVWNVMKAMFRLIFTHHSFSNVIPH